MINRNYFVYRHINKINSKMYVGITKQKLKNRFRNGFGYAQCPKFWQAIQKYGWDNFEHEVLFCNLTKQEAEMFEIELIKYYKTNKDAFGYNIENGGNVCGTHSEEVKKKIAESNRRRVITQETREKMSRNHANFKGKNSVWFGKHHAEETKKKISEKIKGKFSGANNPMYGRRGENSPLFGRKHTQEAKDKMSKALKGRIVSEETREKLRENSWHKKNKGKIVFTEEHKKNIGNALKGSKNPRYNIGIKVICLDNKIVYNSAKQASRELKLDASSITKNCKGKLKQVKGYHFKYFNSIEDNA